MKFSKKFKFNKQIYPLAWQPRRQCCTLAKNSEERSGKRKGGKRNLEKGDEEEGKNGETRMRRVQWRRGLERVKRREEDDEGEEEREGDFDSECQEPKILQVASNDY